MLHPSQEFLAAYPNGYSLCLASTDALHVHCCTTQLLAITSQTGNPSSEACRHTAPGQRQSVTLIARRWHVQTARREVYLGEPASNKHPQT